MFGENAESDFVERGLPKGLKRFVDEGFFLVNQPINRRSKREKRTLRPVFEMRSNSADEFRIGIAFHLDLPLFLKQTANLIVVNAFFFRQETDHVTSFAIVKSMDLRAGVPFSERRI